MLVKVLTSSFAFIVALVVLLISAFQAATPKFEFGSSFGNIDTKNKNNTEIIHYVLPDTGNILPNHFFWPVKVARDKLWLTLTTNPLKKTEILLHLADKRLAASKKLIIQKEYDLGISTLTKAEKYLEETVSQEKIARQKGLGTKEVLRKLSFAVLKHWEEIDKISFSVPPSARQVVIETLEYPKRLYEDVRASCVKEGVEVVECPFFK